MMPPCSPRQRRWRPCRRIAPPGPAVAGTGGPLVRVAATGLGDLGRFSIRRAVRQVAAPVRRVAAPVVTPVARAVMPVLRPVQRLAAPVVAPVTRVVAQANQATVRRVTESDALRTAAARTAVTGAQTGLIVGGSFLGPAGTAAGTIAANGLTAALGPQGQGWTVGGLSVGQIAGSLATGGITSLIPTALQAGTALLSPGVPPAEEFAPPAPSEFAPSAAGELPGDAESAAPDPAAANGRNSAGMDAGAAAAANVARSPAMRSAPAEGLRRIGIPPGAATGTDPTAAAGTSNVPWPLLAMGGAALLALLLLRRPAPAAVPHRLRS